MTSKYLYNFTTQKNSHYLLVFFCLFFLLACNSHNQPKIFDDRSPSVDSIIEKTSHFGKGQELYSLHYIDSSLTKKKLTVPEKMKVLGNKCQAYLFFINDTAKANFYADSMIAFAEANNPDRYPTQYAYAFYSKGDVLFREKKFSEAYTYYYRARSIAKANFNSCALGEYTYRTAMILYKQTRYKEAIETFKKGFAETSTCLMDFGKYFRLQEELNNIALSYYKVGNYDSALLYYDKALKFIDINKDKFDFRQKWHEIAQGVIYGNQGQILKEQGKYDECEKLLKKSIGINLQMGNDISDAQLTYLKLADLFYEQNKIDSMGVALTAIKNSLDNNVSNKQAEIEWSRLMWKYHDRNQHTADAYKYLVLFIQQNDSAQKANKNLNNIDIGQQVRMLEKQHDIDVLKKENDLKQVYLVSALLAAAFVLIIGLFIWQNSRRSKKNLLLSQELNNQINLQKQQLEKTLALLEERNTEKDRILKVVAHDLRTPVASISMLADLMLLENSEAERKEMLQMTKTASENSLTLIAEILEAANVVNSSLAKEKVGINQLVAETTDLLKLNAAEKNQQILIKYLEQEVFIGLNKEKIKRVINNIVTNAIKFSSNDATIKIKATAKNNTVRISVKDEGIGIPDNMKSKVFDVFTDARREGTSGEKPFGLGLSICRQIMEAHGGNIWFKSEQGKGTTFYIELKNE